LKKFSQAIEDKANAGKSDADIFNMLTNGEDAIKRVVAVNRDGKVLPPCGACRELMVQLQPDGYKDVEVMLDYENSRIVTLGELTPEWWI